LTSGRQIRYILQTIFVLKWGGRRGTFLERYTNKTLKMIQQVTAHRETRDGLRTALGYLHERKDIEKCGRTWRVAQDCVRRSDLRYNIGKQVLEDYEVRMPSRRLQPSRRNEPACRATGTWQY